MEQSLILVDSNVLIDVMRKDPIWLDWSLQQLKLARAQGKLFINAVIHAELSTSYNSLDELSAFLKPTGIRLAAIGPQASFLAGKAFLRYRRLRGSKTGVLPDFFIGAHAVDLGFKLLTRDAKRYKSYFPSIELISP